MTVIRSDYSKILHSFGLPFRFSGEREFDLKKNLLTYQVSETRIMDTRKQVRVFDTACEADPGWLMYVCANGVIDKARQVAANIMQSYFERDMKACWLTNFDTIKDLKLATMNLLVIDALFFDSSAYRRDKVYEIINYNCNVPKLSVLVVGQNSDPILMANQLGLKPNMAMMLK